MRQSRLQGDTEMGLGTLGLSGVQTADGPLSYILAAGTLVDPNGTPVTMATRRLVPRSRSWGSAPTNAEMIVGIPAVHLTETDFLEEELVILRGHSVE